MSEAKSDRPDLGVLLVHGIGQQKRGDTLVQFGEPIQQWLRRWFSRSWQPGSHDVAPVADAVIGAPASDPDAPAHAYVELPPLRDGEPESRWLLAEAWWASAFITPRYAELAAWSLQVLPWTFCAHFATRARRVWQRFRRAEGVKRLTTGGLLVSELLFFGLSFAVFPILVTVLLALQVVGALPIPSVRRVLAAFQRILAATLGDSFVLLASPIQEAAIVGKVERDLRWLVDQRCRRIAVVAHSQGAAVAHKAIQRVGGLQALAGQCSEVDPELLFVTIGSGLNKLSAIRRALQRSDRKRTWLAPIGLIVLALGVAETAASLRGDGDAGGAFLPWMITAFGFGATVIGVGSAWSQNRLRPDELRLPEPSRWLDFHASADPVPNGAMYDEPRENQELMDETIRVYNLASPVSDHVTYWKNTDDLVARVVLALATHANLDLHHLDRMDPVHLTVAAARRGWRVRWLIAARVLVLALTIVLGVSYWRDLGNLTKAPIETLRSSVGWLPLLGDALGGLQQIPNADRLLGVIGVLASGGLAYLAIYSSWSAWNRADSRSLFHREDLEPLRWHFVAFVATSLWIVDMFVVTVLGAAAGALGGLIASIVLGFVVSIGILMLLSGGAVFVGAVASLIRFIRKAVGKAPASNPSRAAVGDPDKRVTVSVLVFLLAMFPFTSLFASNTTWRDLWENGIGGVPDQIAKARPDLPIDLWVVVLLVVATIGLVNLVSILGWLRPLHRGFVRAEFAGPKSLAYAALVGPSQARDTLAYRLGEINRSFEQIAQVRAAAPNRSGDKLRRALDLTARRLAHEASEIASKLPDDQLAASPMTIEPGDPEVV